MHEVIEIFAQDLKKGMKMNKINIINHKHHIEVLPDKSTSVD